MYSMECSQEGSVTKPSDLLPFHRMRDQCVSPRLVLNSDFLSPRSSTLSARSITEGSTVIVEREKQVSRPPRPISARKKERSVERVLQDSLRSRFMANLETNLDDEDMDDIWAYHHCKDLQVKGPLERRLLEQGITPVYEPEYKEALCRPLVPDILDLRVFLVSPGPKVGGHFQCHIYREYDRNKLFPRYKLLLSRGDRFLLSARKRKKSKAINYVVSIDENDVSNKTANYFGKLRANFLGTEFIFYDKGQRPYYGLGCLSQTNARMELGGVIYKRSLFRLRGCPKMTAIIPSISDGMKPHVFQPILKTSSTILQKYKSGLDLDKMAVLHKKTSNSNPEIQAYSLDKNGQTTPGSLRNFQLVAKGAQDSVVLQFEKSGKGFYTMDYKYPMSAFQAFAICLSSFENK